MKAAVIGFDKPDQHSASVIAKLKRMRLLQKRFKYLMKFAIVVLGSATLLFFVCGLWPWLGTFGPYIVLACLLALPLYALMFLTAKLMDLRASKRKHDTHTHPGV